MRGKNISGTYLLIHQVKLTYHSEYLPELERVTKERVSKFARCSKFTHEPHEELQTGGQAKSVAESFHERSSGQREPKTCTSVMA